MPSLGYTSVPALLKYLRYAEHMGLSTKAALQAAQISSDELRDNSQRIPSEVHERLIDHLMQVSADPLFDLHAARFVQPGSWSVLGYITMNCATLGEAMSRIVPFEKLVGDMGVSRIEAADDGWFGLVVTRAAVRRLPTAQRAFDRNGGIDIDRLQESALFPGTPVAVGAPRTPKAWKVTLPVWPLSQTGVLGKLRLSGAVSWRIPKASPLPPPCDISKRMRRVTSVVGLPSSVSQPLLREVMVRVKPDRDVHR